MPPAVQPARPPAVPPALPPTVTDLCADLSAEQSELDAVVAGLPAPDWSTPTPAAGWDVRDSISHLCFFDEAATLALSDPPAFAALRRQLLSAHHAETPPDLELGRRSPDDPGQLLARWRTSRRGTRDAVAATHAASPRARVAWFGPPMSVASFTTARLMETWAHGADIRAALGVPLVATPRLRHVIHLGVNARPFSFTVHDVEDPGDPVRVEATAPDGTTWAWGPDDAADRVTGPALDLALVLTQRRHRSRTGVTVTGPTATAWLDIAQAFAGRPTTTAPDR
jgi:uncharacterized protein (TIGR03084 family)